MDAATACQQFTAITASRPSSDANYLPGDTEYKHRTGKYLYGAYKQAETS